MTPVWHPLSALLLTDPPTYATPHLLRLVLRAEARPCVRYAGDRMWPALGHGATVELAPPGGNTLRPGTVVVATPGGIPDLLRVVARDAAGGLRLAGDADPSPPVTARPEELLGVAVGRAGRIPSATVRRLRRAWLDLGEAWRGTPDAAADPAASVLRKYDTQAPFYARSGAAELEARLLQRIGPRVPAGGRMLVVGSGTGRECFRLAEAGWRVRGIDFAPAMVRAAREEAQRRGLDVEFTSGDVRKLRLDAGSLDGVLFTYDVYSFVPGARQRVALLLRLREWLAPGGVLFLSARRVRSVWERTVLSVQWLCSLRRGEREWGRSHTRWVAPGGALERSFVQVFDPRRLRAEARRAGFRAGRWEGGHAVLEPDPPATMAG